MPADKYQPSNATEGDAFHSAWCRRCARDKAMSEGAPIDECDDSERCEIIAKTYLYSVGDPEYPAEWRYQGGQPICAAFAPAGKPVPAPRCEHTIDMFGDMTA